MTKAISRHGGLFIITAAACQFMLASSVSAQTLVFSDDFESDLRQWASPAPEFVDVLGEPYSANRVLMLTPKLGGFSHVLLKGSEKYRNVRMEGRFLFPTEGDGYLGFIYNYQKSENRTDFGCIYVKSNGSYIRMSPHYDGNPSWRLYEELKVSLDGARRIQTGVWYQFRLDVISNYATLYVDDMSTPAAEFDLFLGTEGALGLEARPGRGEPVWVDDVRVYELPLNVDMLQEREAVTRTFTDWEAYRGAVATISTTRAAPEFQDTGWYGISPDRRGAVITGKLTQFTTGDDDIVYLRTKFNVDDLPAPGWLTFSSANQLDIWLNGRYRGSVAPDSFVWADHATSAVHPGARLPVEPIVGENEVLIRVHGNTFAAGGFFAQFLTPGEIRKTAK